MNAVKQYIFDKIKTNGCLLFSLIDPLDYRDLDQAAETAKACVEAGADLILIGGSIGVEGEILDTVSEKIKKVSNIPVVLFPGNISTLTKNADAVYFMSLLNSRNPYWISQAQMLAAMRVRAMKIEPLSVAYLVAEPGGTVGWVGDVNLIPRNKPQIAASMALSAQFLGFSFVLLDAGSNPSNGPVPYELVKAVSKTINIPLIVAGGIRTPEQAKQMAKAGASAIQIGTAFEKKDTEQIKSKVSEFLNAIKQGVSERNE